MKWKRRRRGPSTEALLALATAKHGATVSEALRLRASRVAAEAEAHKTSNGFAEIIASIMSPSHK